MDDLDVLIGALTRDVVPQLDDGAKVFITGDQTAGDDWMLVDDILQFSLLQGVVITPELLESAETIVRRSWDPEIKARTLGWIAKHRETNARLAA